MTIVYPESDKAPRNMSYSFSLVLPLGKIKVTAVIPAKCMTKKGFIKKEICMLLRRPCAANKMKLHIRYGIYPRYTYDDVPVFNPEAVAL